MKGKVKFYNSMKGYGFILPDSRPHEIFFHIREWQNEEELPVVGDVVEFTMGPSAVPGRKDDAKNIGRISARNFPRVPAAASSAVADLSPADVLGGKSEGK